MNAQTSMVDLKGNEGNQRYGRAFGDLPDGTIYYNPHMNINRKALQERYLEGQVRVAQEFKAMTSLTGGTASTDYVLNPIYVDQAIIDISRKWTPLVEMIPRVTNIGRTAEYNRLTAKGGGATYAEDAANPEVNDTYERRFKPIRLLGSVGRVTGLAQASIPSYMLSGSQPVGSGVSPGSTIGSGNAPNAMQLEVLVKAQAMKELEENLIINGDDSSTATDFDGLVVEQGSTNRTALSDVLGLDDLETAVEAAVVDRGRPDFAVASVGVVKDIRNLLRDTFRYGPRDLVGDMSKFGLGPQLVYESMAGPIPIIPSNFLDNTSGSKSIYFIDSRSVEMRVLQDMSYMKFGVTNDSQKFMLKIYETFIMKAPEWNACITSIT